MNLIRPYSDSKENKNFYPQPVSKLSKVVKCSYSFLKIYLEFDLNQENYLRKQNDINNVRSSPFRTKTGCKRLRARSICKGNYSSLRWGPRTSPTTIKYSGKR